MKLASSFCVVLLTLAEVNGQSRMNEALERFRQGLGAINAKYAQPVPPKGLPFPSVQGPKCKSAKIGVVGAGPGGTHMAWQLKQAGFSDVTILEKSDRIGGKSEVYKIRGIPQFVSTILLQPIYAETVFPLLEQFGLSVSATSRLMTLTRNGPEGAPLNFLETLAVSLMKSMGVSDPMEAIMVFLDAVDRYVGMHKEIFGDYPGIMPLRPDEQSSQYLQGTFGDFFERNNLTALYPLVFKIYSNYAYGFPDDVAALYPLLTAKPAQLLGVLAGLTRYTTGEGGLTRLFELFVETEDIPVIFRTDVEFVRKEDNGKIKVFANKGRDVYEYDYLVWAGNLGDFIRSQSNIITDYKEKQLFTETEEFFISSSIVNIKNDIRQTASVLYLENEVLEPNNDVYADADATPYVLNVSDADYAARNYEVEGGADLRTVTCFQMNTDVDKPDPSINELRGKITAHYEKLQATDIEFLQTRTWANYFTHWKIGAANRNAAWDLLDIQGRDNVLWVGAGPGLGEYVKAVLDYNILLMKQFTPAEDCPAPQPAYQRNYFG